MENQKLVSSSRQCSCTPVGFGQIFFLAMKNLTLLEHNPHSPDLAAADFYLFPRLKSALKGQRYCDANIIKNATEKQERLSKRVSRSVFDTFTVPGKSV
jgi:hypothetical protein